MNARWKIRPPGLVLAFGCLLLLVSAYAAWDLHRSQSDASEALALNVVSMRAGEEIAITVRDVRTHLDHFPTDSDPANLDLNQARFPLLGEGKS